MPQAPTGHTRGTQELLGPALCGSVGGKTAFTDDGCGKGVIMTKKVYVYNPGPPTRPRGWYGNLPVGAARRRFRINHLHAQALRENEADVADIQARLRALADAIESVRNMSAYDGHGGTLPEGGREETN